MSPPAGDPVLRFWGKVERTESCWLWRGTTLSSGYGQFAVRFARAQKRHAAHRFAYELLVGPIPEGLQLDHLCRVRHCVNPAHLEPVTGRVNTLRGLTIPAANAAKTHCPQGHPYDPENTWIAKSGRRHCRECGRAAYRRYHANNLERERQRSRDRRAARRSA